MRKQQGWNKSILSAAVADGSALILAILSMFVEVPAVIPSFLVGVVYYGYVVIAQRKRLPLLRVLSWSGVVLSVAAMVLFAFFESKARILLLFTAYGCVGVLLGLSVLQLRKEFKALIVTLSFLLIITNGVYAIILFRPELSIAGFYISMPTAIVEIMFLVKAARIFK